MIRYLYLLNLAPANDVAVASSTLELITSGRCPSCLFRANLKCAACEELMSELPHNSLTVDKSIFNTFGPDVCCRGWRVGQGYSHSIILDLFAHPTLMSALEAAIVQGSMTLSLVGHIKPLGHNLS